MLNSPHSNQVFIPQVLRIKKLKGSTIIKSVCKHNFREIPAEIRERGKIDPTKTYLNEVLVGCSNSKDAKKNYQQVIELAQLKNKVRKDAVHGIEIIFCLPMRHKLNEVAFFESCIAWCREYFRVPILSAVVHRDEDHPHCHIILIPLVNSRLQGSALCGNRSKWRAMQEHFFENVGIHFGLTKPRPTVRYPSEFRFNLAIQIVDYITMNEDCLRDVAVQKELVQLVSSDPIDLAEIVGIEPPRLDFKDRKTYAL